jgi:hypothetical protein
MACNFIQNQRACGSDRIVSCRCGFNSWCKDHYQTHRDTCHLYSPKFKEQVKEEQVAKDPREEESQKGSPFQTQNPISLETLSELKREIESFKEELKSKDAEITDLKKNSMKHFEILAFQLAACEQSLAQLELRTSEQQELAAIAQTLSLIHI